MIEVQTGKDNNDVKITIDEKDIIVNDVNISELQMEKESDNVIRIGAKTYLWKDMNIFQKLLALVFITIVLALTAALIVLVIIPIGIIVVTVLAVALALVVLAIPIWLLKSIIRKK